MTLTTQFIKSCKKGWQCWQCQRRWTYDELGRGGACPHCGGIVRRIDNA